MGTEDRRVQKTRQIIDHACWSLMQEKSFEYITISDIADRANINRATFYRYYVDKYEWLEKHVDELLQELIDVVGAAKETVDSKILLDTFTATFQHFDQHFDIYTVMLSNHGTRFFMDRFHQIQIRMLKESLRNTYSQPQDTEFMAHCIASAVAGLVEWWIRNDRPIPVEQMAAKTLGVHQALQLYKK